MAYPGIYGPYHGVWPNKRLGHEVLRKYQETRSEKVRQIVLAAGVLIHRDGSR